jgi:uncharacterized protein YbcC (UPF0753/DUF2309 family)
MIGLLFSSFMAFKTFQAKIKKTRKKCSLPLANNYSLNEKVNAASSLLKSIGLVDRFAKKILVCAHQSDNTNNPFQSSLHCGACGGNSGIPNAFIICQILNDNTVRQALKKEGIIIPDETQFIAACHHTTSDQIEIISGSVDKTLMQEIEIAEKKAQAEKRKFLPGSQSLSARERSWSELIPELGLINNASLIIGPRELSRSVNLYGRAFLHSYQPSLDDEGEILASILSGPAVVAHWINSQYYFSTVKPKQFGAGNKAIHNVLPGIGVLEGYENDLKIGLPLQSTHFQEKPLHEPRRLTVIVYADKKTLDQAIAKSIDFKQLLTNHWIHLRHVEAK